MISNDGEHLRGMQIGEGQKEDSSPGAFDSASLMFDRQGFSTLETAIMYI